MLFFCLIIKLYFNKKKGAKLFYLTGIVNGEYRRNEIHNLARFISVMKFKEMGFRANHSFLIADRYFIFNFKILSVISTVFGALT